MNARRRTDRRRGTAVLEFAAVAPVVFFLVLFIIVGGLGVFRYQEVAVMSQDAARYAATHGAGYRKDAGLLPGSSADWTNELVANAVAPWTSGFDPKRLTCTVTWPDVSNQFGVPDNWPGSRVTVTVRYQWWPETVLGGPIYLTSTSTETIAN